MPLIALVVGVILLVFNLLGILGVLLIIGGVMGIILALTSSMLGRVRKHLPHKRGRPSLHRTSVSEFEGACRPLPGEI